MNDTVIGLFSHAAYRRLKSRKNPEIAFEDELEEAVEKEEKKLHQRMDIPPRGRMVSNPAVLAELIAS